MAESTDTVLFEDGKWNTPADSLVELGEAWEVKDPSRAEVIYRAAVALDPAHAKGWYCLGKILLSSDPAGAARALHRSDELMPFFPATVHGLCRAYMAMGEGDKAAEQARRYLGRGLRHSGVEKVLRDYESQQGEGQ
jgi:predicted Zn-dependent protease